MINEIPTMELKNYKSDLLLPKHLKHNWQDRKTYNCKDNNLKIVLYYRDISK